MNSYVLPKDFYNLVETPGELKYTLYGDTDSCFFFIPIKLEGVADKLRVANEVAEGINEYIKKYYTECLLPKQNITPHYLQTYFKTEYLMDAILFLDIKKQYAYLIIAKEGKVYDKPTPDYKGIQIVKVDATKMTQNMLREIIDDTLLNKDIIPKERSSKVVNIIKKYRQEYLENIRNFEFDQIASPGKWGKNIQIINSMKIYNFIAEKETFSFGSSGKLVYIKANDLSKFRNFNTDKLETLAIPYKYNKDDLKILFDKYNIELDIEKQWSKKIFTKTCERLVEISKSE